VSEQMPDRPEVLECRVWSPGGLGTENVADYETTRKAIATLHARVATLEDMAKPPADTDMIIGWKRSMMSLLGRMEKLEAWRTGAEELLHFKVDVLSRITPLNCSNCGVLELRGDHGMARVSLTGMEISLEGAKLTVQCSGKDFDALFGRKEK